MTASDGGRDVEANGWVPAFPGQRPPFMPGHEITMRHGAYSPRRTTERANEIVAGLTNTGGSVAYLAAPEYRASVWRYAQRQARADLLHDHLVAHGEECPGCDRCLAWEERWRAFDQQAEKAAVQLGLTPLSRARLGRDVATGRAADAAAALTAMREQHERATRDRIDEGDVPETGEPQADEDNQEEVQ